MFRNLSRLAGCVFGAALFVGAAFSSPIAPAPAVPTVVLVNRSTVISDGDIARMVPALQTQVTRDFVPLWGQDARVVTGRAPAAGEWVLEFADHSDQEDADGYHYWQSGGAGKPGYAVGRVFAADASSVSLVTSHELLEMLGDAHTGRTAPGKRVTGFLWNRKTQLVDYLVEVADPVEADRLGYRVSGILVSDFVTPRWFGLPSPDPRFSFKKRVSRPWELRGGGYISYRTADGTWHEAQMGHKH